MDNITNPENLIAIITSIISAFSLIVALASLFFVLWHRINDKKERFEEMMYESISGLAVFIYDTYKLLSEEYCSNKEIIQVEEDLTKNFVYLDTYARGHNNGLLQYYAVINSSNESINNISFPIIFI